MKTKKIYNNLHVHRNDMFASLQINKTVEPNQ